MTAVTKEFIRRATADSRINQRFGKTDIPSLRSTLYQWRRSADGVKTEAWRIDCDHQRPHGSLGHLTPMEFATHVRNNGPKKALL